MINVNQHTISETQILNEMQYHPADDHRAAMVEAAQSLIIGELLQQRAQALNINLDTHASDTDEQRQNKLLEKLIASEVQLPRASATECEHYYQQNKTKFTTPPLIAAKHILLAAPSSDEKARSNALNQAESLLSALSEGASFSELAQQYSKCDSAQLGGQLGQITKGQTVSEFERQVFSAEVGLIAHPIETRFGYHLVYIDHKEPGLQLPFEAVKSRIEDYLNKKVERKAIAQYIQLLIADADIEGFDFNVSSSPLVQ
jgi:peptidyl-prolyl cis-trans isomerase C